MILRGTVVSCAWELSCFSAGVSFRVTDPSRVWGSFVFVCRSSIFSPSKGRDISRSYETSNRLLDIYFLAEKLEGLNSFDNLNVCLGFEGPLCFVLIVGDTLEMCPIF